jgi:AraC family ethanolamine operon transcriptional activator
MQELQDGPIPSPLNPMTPDTHIHRLESSDFEEMEQTLDDWDHRYRQVGPGKFRGGLLLTQVGSVGIFRNRWERAIHYQGVAPKGTIALGVTLVQTGEGRWMGQPATINDVLVQPQGAEAEYISAPLWDSVVLAIPEVDLLERMANLTQADPVDMLRRPSLAHLTTQMSAQVRQACMAYLHTAEQCLARPDAPSPLPEMAKSTVDLVARALVSSAPAHDPKPSVRRQRQLVANVVDYCDHRADQPIQIHELCHELEVSERTLRYAFQHVIGASPLTFLKGQRLNRVYRALRRAGPAARLVKQVARDNGFSHLGQFSQDYKQLFGEAPSTTLQRG